MVDRGRRVEINSPAALPGLGLVAPRRPIGPQVSSTWTAAARQCAPRQMPRAVLSEPLEDAHNVHSGPSSQLYSLKDTQQVARVAVPHCSEKIFQGKRRDGEAKSEPRRGAAVNGSRPGSGSSPAGRTTAAASRRVNRRLSSKDIRSCVGQNNAASLRAMTSSAFAHIQPCSIPMM